MSDFYFDVTKDLRVSVIRGEAKWSGAGGWTDKTAREEVAWALSGLERDAERLREWLRVVALAPAEEGQR